MRRHRMRLSHATRYFAKQSVDRCPFGHQNARMVKTKWLDTPFAAGVVQLCSRPEMFTRSFHADRFLRSVWGTEPFLDYCRRHRLSVEHFHILRDGASTCRRWAAALAQLSPNQRTQVET